MNTYRHGDLSFHTTKEAKGKIIGGSGSVLALGEATGHKHVVSGDVKVYRDQLGNTYLVVGGKGASLTHEEHSKVVLSPGNYQMKNEREFDWFSLAVQRVVD